MGGFFSSSSSQEYSVGDVIRTLIGNVYHFGLVVAGKSPNQKVIHFTGSQSAPVQKTDLRKFGTNCAKVSMAGDGARAASRANHFFSNPGEVGMYNTISNNCYHFVQKCYEN